MQQLNKILLLTAFSILPTLANAKTLQPNNMPTGLSTTNYSSNYNIKDTYSFIIYDQTPAGDFTTQWDIISKKDIAKLTDDKNSDTCTIERKHNNSITVRGSCKELKQKIDKAYKEN